MSACQSITLHAIADSFGAHCLCQGDKCGEFDMWDQEEQEYDECELTRVDALKCSKVAGVNIASEIKDINAFAMSAFIHNPNISMFDVNSLLKLTKQAMESYSRLSAARGGFFRGEAGPAGVDPEYRLLTAVEMNEIEVMRSHIAELNREYVMFIAKTHRAQQTPPRHYFQSHNRHRKYW